MTTPLNAQMWTALRTLSRRLHKMGQGSTFIGRAAPDGMDGGILEIVGKAPQSYTVMGSEADNDNQRKENG